VNVPKLHAAELDISAGLAARLIAQQFPSWARLPVSPVAASGTECVLFRLGTDLVVRLPRLPGPGLGAILEQGFLARLAPHLPVRVPELIAQGEPTAEYPARWGVLRWLDGATPVEGQLSQPGRLADDLAGFLRALWSVDLPEAGLVGAPAAYRGGPPAAEHDFTLNAIAKARALIDADAALAIWEEARRLPAWPGPPTWIHADLMPGNVLTSASGGLAAVLDWFASGLGDPSLDLIVAWMLLPASVRPAFRAAIAPDEATWLRGRARALSWAVGHLDYYADTNPAMVSNARYTISEVLADARRGG
jgi:aminoglycoside phosphotransferase (APT) family kinase protein